MALENIRLDGDNNIDAAVSLEVVETAKDNAINGMDAVRTIVETEIAADAAVTIAENDPTVHNIEDAYSLILELPDGIAKTSLSNRLHTAAENEALDDLFDAYDAYDSDNYTAENWTILDNYYDQGRSDIIAATTLVQIQEAYNTAIAGMAGVPATVQATVSRVDAGDGTYYLYYELGAGNFNTTTVIDRINWGTVGFIIERVEVTDSKHLIITSDSIIHSGTSYQLTPYQDAMAQGCIPPDTQTANIVTFPTVTSDAYSTPGIQYISFDLLSGDATFSANATNIGNWTLGGTNAADLGIIQSIEISGAEMKHATIRVSGGTAIGRNYTIIYSQYVLGPGYNAPTVPLTVRGLAI
jgi:hypothetical protein